MKRLTLLKSENKTIKEGFDEFITHCKVKNLSAKTIEYYQQYMK